MSATPAALTPKTDADVDDPAPTLRSVRYAELSLFADPIYWSVPIGNESADAGDEDEPACDSMFLEPRFALVITAAAVVLVLVPLAIIAAL